MNNTNQYHNFSQYNNNEYKYHSHNNLSNINNNNISSVNNLNSHINDIKSTYYDKLLQIKSNIKNTN